MKKLILPNGTYIPIPADVTPCRLTHMWYSDTLKVDSELLDTWINKATEELAETRKRLAFLTTAQHVVGLIERFSQKV